MPEEARGTWYECWKQNSDLLQERRMPLATEPSLQPLLMLSWLTYYPALLRDLISCQSFTSCPHPKVTPSVFSISIRHSVITFIYYFFYLILVACVCTSVCAHVLVRTCTCAHMHSMHGTAVEVRGQSGGVGYLLPCWGNGLTWFFFMYQSPEDSFVSASHLAMKVQGLQTSYLTCCEFWGSNSGHWACTASAWIHWATSPAFL